MEHDVAIRLAQERETPVRLEHNANFTWRYAYARAAETRVAGDTGQDYLTLHAQDRLFCFALCDGVSQSFFGELAARVLGDSLMSWLETAPGQAFDPEALRASLTAHLVKLTDEGTAVVAQHPLPEGIPNILQGVLEQKRHLGSESTFICGRVDLPAPGMPHGRLLLAWMGDSRLRLWGPHGERSVELGGEFVTDQRWSSRTGPVTSGPHLFLTPLADEQQQTFSRLLVYSDGLIALDSHTRPLTNLSLQDVLTRSALAPTSDDLSVVELWIGEAPLPLLTAGLPAPTRVKAEPIGAGLRLAWLPVVAATRYQVELLNGDVQQWDVDGAGWELPALPEGPHQLRVRAMRQEEPGEWSAPVMLGEAALLPAAATSAAALALSMRGDQRLPEVWPGASPPKVLPKVLAGSGGVLAAVVVVVFLLLGRSAPVQATAQTAPTRTAAPAARPLAVASAAVTWTASPTVPPSTGTATATATSSAVPASLPPSPSATSVLRSSSVSASPDQSTTSATAQTATRGNASAAPPTRAPRTSDQNASAAPSGPNTGADVITINVPTPVGATQPTAAPVVPTTAPVVVLPTPTNTAGPRPGTTPIPRPTNAPGPPPTNTPAPPGPTNTPVPPPTNTPVPPGPTNTPVPGATNTPTSTPRPTNTPRPTSTPKPPPTPIPTNTPSCSAPGPGRKASMALMRTTPDKPPTDTPVPTNTPAPTNTPVPTNTPLPTNTPMPTNTPPPTSTPMPTNTPTC